MKIFVYRIKIKNKILEMMLILVNHPAGVFFENLFILGFFHQFWKNHQGWNKFREISWNLASNYLPKLLTKLSNHVITVKYVLYATLICSNLWTITCRKWKICFVYAIALAFILHFKTYFMFILIDWMSWKIYGFQ